jgi:CheY-like chemotaxis protein
MESVGRLAGGVAHDFNNLLTVIAGYTQHLKSITSEEIGEKLDGIRSASDRAAALVRQLLAFSRKQPLQPRTLDLNAVIRNMSDMIRGVLNEQIDLALHLAPDLGSVEADPHQLEQIILNLASNARDAMPGGGELIIRTWNEIAPQTGFVGLSVTDNGHGMDRATQNRVFEPFFSTKPRNKGSGLGLATVYGTVKQSRGQISVASEIGKGATFTILLPCAAGAAQGTPQPVSSKATRGTETILLVEDDAAVLEVLTHGLEQEGYRVFQASNGRDALSQFAAYGPEIALIVTDLIMPEMGGITLGENLRDAGAALPIVYMTGYHQDLEKYPAEGLPLGCGFLLKPFSPQVLAATIRKTFAAQVKAVRAAGQ